jgi:hypothetical protein
MTKALARNQGWGLDQTQKLKNVNLNLIATPPWTMEFMASLAMAATEKTKCIIICYTINKCPTHKNVNKWFPYPWFFKSPLVRSKVP